MPEALAVVAHADGGARGNPGPAACAAVVYAADGSELLRRARTLGSATNNVAEYAGAAMALEACAELGAREVTLRLDSELVVRQLEGRYRVRNAGLKPWYARVRSLCERFDRVRVEHVSRGDNALADALVNAALDGRDPESVELA